MPDSYVTVTAYARSRGRKPDPIARLVDAGEIPGALRIPGQVRTRRYVRRYVDPELADQALEARPPCRAHGCSNRPLGTSGYCGDHWLEAGQAGRDALRLSSEQLAETRRRYLDHGLTTVEIADQDGVTPQAVDYRLRRAGVTDRVPLAERRAAKLAAAKAEHGATHTAAEFAAITGLLPSRVAGLVREGYLEEVTRVNAHGPSARLLRADPHRFLRDWALGQIRVAGQLRPFTADEPDKRRSSWLDPQRALARLEAARRLTTIDQQRRLRERLNERSRLLANAAKGARTPGHYYEWAESFLAILASERAQHRAGQREKPPTNWEVAGQVAREDWSRFPVVERYPGWERAAAKSVWRAINSLQIALPES